MYRRKKKPESVQRLNDEYRNGGDIQEDRELTWDSTDAMNRFQKNPISLNAQLRSMGITESGDDPADVPAD